MWDTIIQILSNPDTWTLLFGFIGTSAAAAGAYLVKKFNWKLAISLKPDTPAIGPAEVAELIEKKLKEAIKSQDYETLKASNFQLQALFDVSRSQWEEQIRELTAENELLKADKTALEKLER